jgi:hypothetical protein
MSLRPRLAALIAASLLMVSAGADARAPAQVKLADIRIQFLYGTSGSLSEDLTKTPDFAIWNTIIGEGGAKEPADDLLVSAVLTSPETEVNTGPLTLTVYTAEGKPKVLGRHVFTGALMQHGQVVQSMLLHDATCAGLITVEATYGRQRRTAKIDMACGE